MYFGYITEHGCFESAFEGGVEQGGNGDFKLHLDIIMAFRPARQLICTKIGHNT
jgi:hypothetical protein